VLSTFPESKRLSIHRLPEGQDRSRIVLFWRKGAHSPKIDALIGVLQTSAHRLPLSFRPRRNPEGPGTAA
jgi:hypothetical protein